MFTSLLLYAAMLLVVAASLGKIKGRRDFLKKLGFERIRLRREIPAAMSYLFLMFFASILLGIFIQFMGLQTDAGIVPQILKNANFAELLIVLSVASFVEEIFFRGFLQRKTNILFASFVFAFFHISYGSVSELLGTFVLGCILGKEYQKTRNLAAPILSHLFYNLITVALVFTI